MNKWFVTSLLAVATGALALAPRARSQPGDDFTSQVITKPAAAPTQPNRPAPTASSALPAGVQPARSIQEAAPNPYPLPASAGAWLICAAAYTGPDGPELAKQVCEDLRKQQMAAYIYNRGAEERKKQEEEWQRLQQAHPGVPLRRKGVRIVDHYAVLIGGWADFKSASEALPKFKALDLPELKLDGGKSAYELMVYYETDPNTKKPILDPKTGQPVTRHGKVNPYHSAMVTRNPLAPTPQVARPTFDPIWAKLNADEEYSLLRSKGKITLIVKEYAGGREMQARSSGGSFLKALGMGDKQGEGLQGAAVQAHTLAKFLRDQPKLGLKAFVFHTRHSSLVTVGEFSSMDDPKLRQMQQTLATMRFTHEQTRTDFTSQIGLLPSPIPVEIPRP